MGARFFGYMPDPPKSTDWDHRDLYEKLRLSTPRVENLDYIPLIPEILDQGPIGACVTNSGFGAVRVKHVLQGIKDPLLGARGIGYYLLRGYIGTEEVDSGGYIRNFFDGLNYFGFATEQDYPYEPKKLAEAFNRGDAPTDKPPPEFFRDAFDQKDPARYWRLNSMGSQRVVEMKAAIDAGNPIVAGTNVGFDFLDWTGSIGEVCPLRTGGIAGGHAIYSVGYNKIGMVFTNSWGKNWGEGGLFTVSWNNQSLGDIDDMRDIWVVEHAPYFSEEIA